MFGPTLGDLCCQFNLDAKVLAPIYTVEPHIFRYDLAVNSYD